MARKKKETQTPAEVAPTRIIQMKVRSPGVSVGRYIECPGSRHMHEPRLVPLLKGAKAHFYRCTCTGNGFMAKTWESSMGYTLEQAKELAKVHGYSIVGL